MGAVRLGRMDVRFHPYDRVNSVISNQPGKERQLEAFFETATSSSAQPAVAQINPNTSSMFQQITNIIVSAPTARDARARIKEVFKQFSTRQSSST